MSNLRETLAVLIKEVLAEQHMPVNIMVNGKPVPFGSKPHLEDLKATYEGLERLKNAYKMGSSSRHVYAMACQRLRKLIQTLESRMAGPTVEPVAEATAKKSSDGRR